MTGEVADPQGEPRRTAIHLATTFVLAGEPSTSPFQYGRLHNRTWLAFEERLGAMDGGPAACFSSGMAAITALLQALLSPGDSVVLPGDGYYTVGRFARSHLRRMGIESRFVATGDSDSYSRAVPGASVVWIETPCNPGLDVADIESIAAQARAAGAVTVVDNTLATPAGQRPLALGADYVAYSVTKVLGGHSDVVAGAVVARDGAHLLPVRRWRDMTGAVPGPQEAWLAERSLMTLRMRVERQSATAGRVAEWLAGDPAAGRVRYPGLPGDPAHATAARQMTHFGQLVTFDLGGAGRADAFLAALRTIGQATSYGGVESTAERRARWKEDRSPPGLIRLSCGAEDPEDLIADLRQALDRSAPP